VNSLAVDDAQVKFYNVQRLHSLLDGNVLDTVWFNSLPIIKAA
jgi:hypothetical protein